MKVELNAAPGLYLPEMGECILYSIASNPEAQVGYCAGYEVWDEYREQNQPRTGNNGARFHVKIANTPGGKVINMRGIHDVSKATLLQEVHNKYKGYSGYNATFIKRLIDEEVITRD